MESKKPPRCPEELKVWKYRMQVGKYSIAETHVYLKAIYGSKREDKSEGSFIFS